MVEETLGAVDEEEDLTLVLVPVVVTAAGASDSILIRGV